MSALNTMAALFVIALCNSVAEETGRFVHADEPVVIAYLPVAQLVQVAELVAPITVE